MIRYALICDAGHAFEAWFRNGETCTTQLQAGDVECPDCGSRAVSKALMAPNVVSGRKKTERAEDFMRAAIGAVKSEMHRAALQKQAGAQPSVAAADSAGDAETTEAAASGSPTAAAPQQPSMDLTAQDSARSETRPSPVPTDQEAREAVGKALEQMRREVEENCDYVGDDFAEEARRMYYGEADERPIYGEATLDEAEALTEEGIGVAMLPWRRTDS
ncbi:MAG: DUF1178 family protein [Rhodospirillaceae bacterium]